MRTGNPTLNDKTFENFGVYRHDLASERSSAEGDEEQEQCLVGRAVDRHHVG